MRLQWGFLPGLILAVACAAAFGANWGQWRGPDFNGSSDARNLLASLDPNTLLWKTALPGLSAATPVVLAIFSRIFSGAAGRGQRGDTKHERATIYQPLFRLPCGRPPLA